MSFVQAQVLVLLAVSPMLMKTSRERKMKFSTLGNADVKSVGRDKDVEKTEKQIADSRDDVWFKKKKKGSRLHCCETQNQRNLQSCFPGSGKC